MHLPFGKGVVDFDQVVPLLAKEQLSHDWWTIDLCFWPDAWQAGILAIYRVKTES